MASGLTTILALEVPVIVQIAERIMTVEEVTGIAPGAIIELSKSANDDLEILVNNTTIGTGNAVKVGENYGIRVTFLGDLDDRISAMGSERPVRPVEDHDEEADSDKCS